MSAFVGKADIAIALRNVRFPQGNIVGCLTMAKHMVSSQCNAALDAAFLR
jgi:hypothetical protein